MEQETIRRNRESGQTVVLFALAVIGLVAFVGLAVDGGNVFNERRVVQNAVDASALRGVHYIASSDAPEEATLCATVNGIVEGNGVPDTDGVAGNAINVNVHIVYTNADGEPASIDPLAGGPQVDCGSPRDHIPEPARGVEVSVDSQTDTFFLGVIGMDTLPVGGRAVAVITGKDVAATNLDGNALVAFGNDCTWEDGPLDMSGHFVDVIGGVHSDSYYVNRGHENHYHGAVTYVQDAPDYAPNGVDPSQDGVFDPPYEHDPDSSMGDPFAALGLTANGFNCTNGEFATAAINAGECYDLTGLAPAYGNEVNTRLLTQNSPDGGEPYLSEETGKLRDGIYYAEGFPFFFGLAPEEIEDPPEDHPPGLHGEVTLVTDKYIKITENDVQLTGYMPEGSILPGLLMFSTLDPEAVDEPRDRCTGFDNSADEYFPINTTGNEGTVPPKVTHTAGCYDPSQGECDYDYEEGSLYYRGILYAPNGGIATSGHGATYIGALVGHTIRVNGYVEYCDWYSPYPCRPEVNEDDWTGVPGNPPYQGPYVGALFVFDHTPTGEDDAVINLNR